MRLLTNAKNADWNSLERAGWTSSGFHVAGNGALEAAYVSR